MAGSMSHSEFADLVAQLVAGEFADPIAQTDCRPEQFSGEAFTNRAEIEVEAAEALEQVQLKQRSLTIWRRAVRQRALFAVGAAIAAIATAALSVIPTTLSGWITIGIASLLTAYLAASLHTWRRSRPTLIAAVEAAELDYRETLERAATAWLAEAVNRELGEIYADELPLLNPEGLAEVDDSEREITTDTTEQLEKLIEGMPGGSIGVSGPRGAGKSTLLKRITVEAWQRNSAVRAGVVVDAPVDYDPREFVLHLFARLCESVLDPDRVEALRGWDRGFFAAPPPPRRTMRFLRSPLPPWLGPLLIAAGLLLYLSVLAAQGKIQFASLGPVAIALLVAGSVLIYFTYVPTVFLRLLISNPRRLLLAMRGLLGLIPADEADIRSRAERLLRQIWFQHTYSTGFSGGLKTPIGIEAGAERKAQLAENQLGLPDIVALYKGFVAALAFEGEVRIGIDELDKMDDERARRFLNEIKVIFRISGCFYLVSVSEDAMSYFERRGLPFRDVFDSSFDDVQRVGYLPYRDSHRILRRRVVGLPIQFVAICHILGGGLARDVIRVARDVCEHGEGTKLDHVTVELCADELRDKCAAARVAIRRLREPARVILLSRWLREVEEAALDNELLLERCRRFEVDLVALLSAMPSHEGEALTEHREALSIALEVVTFSYFVLTLRDFLPELTSERDTQTAIASAAVDRLAEARQAFAINPAEAWEAISSVRDDLPRTEAVEFPIIQDAVDRERTAPNPVGGIRQTAGP